jgi:hypothetical protein
MTRTKVLLVALGIIVLGAAQFLHFYRSAHRASGIGTASGVVALLTGAGIGAYGLSLRRHP